MNNATYVAQSALSSQEREAIHKSVMEAASAAGVDTVKSFFNDYIDPVDSLLKAA